MADQLEGTRSLPVKFRDMGDGSVAEVISLAGGTVTQTDFTYDSDGNLIGYTEGGTAWTLTYDGDGNLLSVTGV